MHTPQWCLFYDNHTMVMCPDVGEGFDVEAFTDRIKDCGVDFLTFHARCNQGNAYYNTDIGTRHPSLSYDLFGELAEACERKNIALSAYFNAGLSHEEGVQHREWLRVGPEGEIYSGDWGGPFYKTMCYNTGYSDHLIAMIVELVENYPVSGLFIDCVSVPYTRPCLCPNCVREMKERGMDWKEEADRRAFGKLTYTRLIERITEAATAVDPDLLLYFNGAGAETQSDYGNYMECECLPTSSGWGYEYLPVMSRYLRTLGYDTVLNMTGRFSISWGDFGGLRTKPSLTYDCIYGLANGMRPNIGGHFHPRGDLDEPVFDLIEDVYKELQPYDPWFEDAEPLSDMAVVSTTPDILGEGLDITKSATRMLCELNQQFDVVTPFSSWEDYSLLVLPDTIRLDDDLSARLKRHLEDGGAVISSYKSGLRPEEDKFALPQWGLSYLGDDPVKPPYIVAEPAFSEGIPDMPMCVYEAGIHVEPASEAEILARVVDPYYNEGFDGEHANYYTPPDDVTDKPAIVQSGSVIHFVHPIFRSYFNQTPLHLRQHLSNALQRLLPEPLLQITNFPSFGRSSVTGQDNRRMVFLMTYVPEHRGAGSQRIEEAIAVRDVCVRLRTDGRVPDAVYLAPDRLELEFTVNGSYVEVTVPEVEGYAVVVFEEK